MMYLINLTLTGQEADYTNLIGTIKTLGPWSNRLMNTFLLECPMTSVQIRDLLKPHLRPGDRVFVGEFIRNWAATGMGADFPQWIGRRNFREIQGPGAPAVAAGAPVPEAAGGEG